MAQMTTPRALPAIGQGPQAIHVLIVPGIFEGDRYREALHERLVVDARADAAGIDLAQAATVHLHGVVPPGYAPRTRDEIPTNANYRAAISAAMDALPTNGATAHVFHSWGGAAGSTVWRDRQNRRPDAAILSAPAWSDCVTRSATVAGKMLRWGLLQRAVAAPAYRVYIGRRVVRTGLASARTLMASQPHRNSSTRAAYASIVAVHEGPTVSHATQLLPFAARRVAVVQGDRDTAVQSEVCRPAYERLQEPCRYVRCPDADHFPLIEEPGLLAGLLQQLLTTASTPLE
jgi:pimeloyl-ACP methyl ester carboxylesterase